MAAAGGYVQLAVETTPNGQNNPSTVSSTVFYHPATQKGWSIPPIFDDRTDELRGVTDNVQKDVVGFNPQVASASLRAYANLLPLHLWACHGAGVFTAGNGSVTDPGGTVIPAGANMWQFTAGTNNGPCRSLQAISAYPDQSVFIKQQGIVWEQIQMSHNGEIGMLACSGHNLYTTRISDPSLTPTYDALTVKPFLRSMMAQPNTWLASSGVQSAFGWTLANPVSWDTTLAGSLYPDSVDRTGVDLNLTLQLGIRNLDAADIDALIAGTGFSIRNQWVSTQFITGSYPYKLFVEANGVYTDLTPDALQHKIRHGGTLTVDCGRASGGSWSYRITVVNGVSSYSSVG
jgi:hypothetical protein